MSLCQITVSISNSDVDAGLVSCLTAEGHDRVFQFDGRASLVSAASSRKSTVGSIEASSKAQVGGVGESADTFADNFVVDCFKCVSVLDRESIAIRGESGDD